MGWKGTVRTLGAMARQAERDSMRRAREHAKHVAFAEKIEAKEQAREAVSRFDDYLERVVSIHKTCSEPRNWAARANSRPPTEPVKSSENEREAQTKLDNYKASWFTRLFKREEKERLALALAVEEGKAVDGRLFAEKSAKHKEDAADHAEEVAFANRILKNEPDAMLEAIKLYETLASIGLLGEHMTIKVMDAKVLAVDLDVHSEEVIPKDRPKLLASGRASVKPMPKGDYNRLYQDHVCSAGLRVARELLALLPIDEVIVTAYDELVDTATGHLAKTPILSFRAPRLTIGKINFGAIDPSDSMKNFVHHMEFNPTRGFKGVTSLIDR